MSSYLESGEIDIGDGQQIMFIDRIIPDFTDRDGDPFIGELDLYIQYRSYPGDTLKTKGPYTVSAATDKINPRVRARQIALRLESSDLDQSWRLGALRFRVGPDGEA
jgi:hypothetical protein